MREPARARRVPGTGRGLTAMPPTFQAIPIFRIFDEAKAKEFYVGFLGFRVDREARFDETAPLYMQVSATDSCST